MIREIILDTETTGLDAENGDRIVEIGCLELVNRLPSGEVFHVYVNPEREMPSQAEAIHGLSATFLADKPIFAGIAEDFLAFIGDAPLIIHNAAFDMAFLNAEFLRAGYPPLDITRAIDTLAMARKKFPGAPASLDALCRRFGIDNSARGQHSALLDSQLLAQVYLELSGGRQPDLVFRAPTKASVVEENTQAAARTGLPAPRPTPLASRLSANEQEAHLAFLKNLPAQALWLKDEKPN